MKDFTVVESLQSFHNFNEKSPHLLLSKELFGLSFLSNFLEEIAMISEFHNNTKHN